MNISAQVKKKIVYYDCVISQFKSWFNCSFPKSQHQIYQRQRTVFKIICSSHKLLSFHMHIKTNRNILQDGNVRQVLVVLINFLCLSYTWQSIFVYAQILLVIRVKLWIDINTEKYFVNIIYTFCFPLTFHFYLELTFIHFHCRHFTSCLSIFMCVQNHHPEL